jgi:GT2 family glycosyltransferase
MCHPNSHIAYELTLPKNARVMAWCTLAPEAWPRNRGGVEFEIQVRASGFDRSERRVINARWWFNRRWHALNLKAPLDGAARVVFATRIPEGGSADYAWALWGDPCIEFPRSLSTVVSAVRTALSSWGIRGLWYRAVLALKGDLYSLWVREHEPSREALRAQREWSLRHSRLFSLITLVPAPATWRARETATSVFSQSYPSWEWILVANDDSLDDVRKAVGRFGDDRRVHLVGVAPGSSRAEAWNVALGEASGEFAALVDEGDQLAPAALYEMANALERSPGCDLLYSDEDLVGARRFARHGPRFKPDWSPDLLLASNYIGRLALMRVGVVKEVDGFREGYDGSEEWDLYLRLSRRRARIQRVPRCLYHRQTPVNPDADAGEKAVIRDHWEALGKSGTLSKSVGGWRLLWPADCTSRVSVVIPNRNAAAVLRQCLRGLLQETSYPSLEVVIVENHSTEPEVFELYRSLERDARVRLVTFDHPFNFSAACNVGAAAATGDLLLFLNNDVEVIEPDWLQELVRWVQLPDVGAVGAKLLYPNRTIQHAGVVFGLGLVGHIFSRAAESLSGPFGSTESYRNFLAVTGACQMIRREVFQRLGGFDERFRISFSDVVLCLEAWKAGYRVVYTPYARLVHHESYTRRREDCPEDLHLMVRYLAANGFVEDPYFHPELNATSPMPIVRLPVDPSPHQVVHDYMERVISMAAAR